MHTFNCRKAYDIEGKVYYIFFVFSFFLFRVFCTIDKGNYEAENTKWWQILDPFLRGKVVREPEYGKQGIQHNVVY